MERRNKRNVSRWLVAGSAFVTLNAYAQSSVLRVDAKHAFRFASGLNRAIRLAVDRARLILQPL